MPKESTPREQTIYKHNSDTPKKQTTTFIESPKWINNKKCSINPQNNDNKDSQYSVTLSLCHKQTKKNLFRI